MEKLNSLNKVIENKKCEIAIREIRCSILKNIIRDEENKLSQEEREIGEMKEIISSSRKLHCDNARIFSNDYGIRKIVSNIVDLAKKRRLDRDNDECLLLNDLEEVQFAITQNQTLRTLLANTLSETEICQRKLNDLNEKVKILEEEYNEGSEILRLKSAISLSMQQTKELEAKYYELKKNSSDNVDINQASDTINAGDDMTNLKHITVTSENVDSSQVWQHTSRKKSKFQHFKSFKSIETGSIKVDPNNPLSSVSSNELTSNSFKSHQSKPFEIMEKIPSFPKSSN